MLPSNFRTRPTPNAGGGAAVVVPVYDPAVLALKLWYRAGATWSAAAGEWSGTASAGPSGDADRKLTSPGSKPTDNAGLNSLKGPHFAAGSSQYLLSGKVLSDAISASAFSGWVVGNSSVFTAGNADGGPGFIADNGRYWGAYACTPVATPSFSAFTWHSGRHQDDQSVSSGVNYLFQFYSDGTKLYTRLNHGSWSAGTTAGSVDNLGGAIIVGLGGAFLTGDIYDIGVINTSLFATPAAAESIREYVNDRYGTSF